MELESFITLHNAIERGRKHPPPVRKRKISVEESAGAYSFETIRAQHDFPPYDRSAVDGYAIISNESISSSRSNPSTFVLTGSIFPWSDERGKISNGEAMKIATGSQIPEGADCVVMLEDTQLSGNIVSVYSPARRFQNISRVGEDLKLSTVLLRKGERITPPHIVALKETGVASIDVYDISIGILSTGNELISGRVINSTQPFLKSLFEWKGFRANNYGVVGDDTLAIKKALDGIKDDIIIVTGGTGPGEADLVPEFVSTNGELIFRGLKIRPARTTGFGIYRGKPIFIISGLPVAALIASENVILKLISIWSGIELEEKIIVEGKLQRSVVNTVGMRSFVRVRIVDRGNEREIIPTRTTGSGVIYSVIGSQGILEIDENSEGIEAGTMVRVQLLRW